MVLLLLDGGGLRHRIDVAAGEGLGPTGIARVGGRLMSSRASSSEGLARRVAAAKLRADRGKAMTDERYSPRPIAGWYMAAAIGSLLFMLVACGSYLLDVTRDPSTLPLDLRAAAEARPVWAMPAYAIAVWVGLCGAIMLVLKKKLAQPLMLISLVAVAVTFLPFAVVPDVRDNITTNDIAFAVAILAITWTIFWFARHSAQRGWLR